jgi:ParB family chromosome partitioning protein
LFISITKIAPNPSQPRKLFREAELAELAASIREQGILQPLVVRRRGDGYELIIGERRWRASQIAGLDEVPAVILDASDRQVVEMALVENVQRADLNPMELAEAFKVLVDDEQMTQDEVGRRVGLDRSSVANHLRLLELPSDIQQDLIDQRITMGHAKAILQVPRRRGARWCATRSCGESRFALRGPRTTPRHRGRVSRGQAVARRARGRPRGALRKALQTKVRIVGRRGRGRIELEFYGEGELDRLSNRLLGGES